MPEEIKVGSRVKVVADGPEMTVEKITNGKATCWWYKKTAEIFTQHEFAIEMLKLSVRPLV